MAYGTLNAGTITPGSGNTLAISEAVTVPTPTATTHATTKAYVDSAATQATTAAQGVGTGNTPEFAGVKITASGGINFSAYATSGNPSSNLLNDYEEGTFSLQLGSSGGGGTYTMNSGHNTGYYTKIGKVVTFNISAGLSSFSAGSAGSLILNSLPFAVNNTTAGRAGGGLGVSAGDPANGAMSWYCLPNTTTIYFGNRNTNSYWQTIGRDKGSSSMQLDFSGSYVAA
jgi:hypothetical protein